MKKAIHPLDRLQHVFNDVLEDLKQAIKRTWACMELEEREQLQEALDAKLGAHRDLFADALLGLSETGVQAPFYKNYTHVRGSGKTEARHVFEMFHSGIVCPCEWCSEARGEVQDPDKTAVQVMLEEAQEEIRRNASLILPKKSYTPITLADGRLYYPPYAVCGLCMGTGEIPMPYHEEEVTNCPKCNP